jgi:hypothetical protein
MPGAELEHFFLRRPDAGAVTRRELFEEIADTDVIIVPEHVPFPTAGRIRSDGDRFRYRFAFPWWRGIAELLMSEAGGWRRAGISAMARVGAATGVSSTMAS